MVFVNIYVEKLKKNRDGFTKKLHRYMYIHIYVCHGGINNTSCLSNLHTI